MQNHSNNFEAEIIPYNINKKLSYDQTDILTLEISYPKIHLINNPFVQNRINATYQREVDDFYKYATKTLRKDAIENYHYTKNNDFPFHPYEAVMNYEITQNENCILSTFFDQYEFTGGAHGNTIRFSNNWDLQTGALIKLYNLFPIGAPYRQLVVSNIILIADKQMKENPYIYFEDYRELIIKYFNANNFNLTPTGISVYYQQYEIGPYASGIIVFDIPYEQLEISPPCCKIL